MAQQCGVDRPAGRRAEDPDVADREADRKQHADVAAADDGDDAYQRERDAERLNHAQRLAVDGACEHDDEDRRGGVDQPDVGRSRGVGADIDEGAAHPHAERAEHQKVAPFVTDRPALAPQRAGGEGRQHDQGDGPAPERQGDRRDRVGGRPCDQHVGGEQGGRDEQQHHGNLPLVEAQDAPRGLRLVHSTSGG